MTAVMPSPDRPMLARLLQRLPGFRTPSKRALVLAGGGGGGSDESEVRHRGMYAVMEQAGHITSIKLLELGLHELRLRHPEIEVHVIQPDPVPSPLRGSSMGFEASRAALRFGYTSVKDYLGGEAAAPLRRRFGIRAA